MLHALSIACLAAPVFEAGPALLTHPTLDSECSSPRPWLLLWAQAEPSILDQWRRKSFLLRVDLPRLHWPPAGGVFQSPIR